MRTSFEIPEWLVAEPSPPPPLPPVDDHRVEGLVNGFIAGKQEALFTAPDAYYRQQGRDALDGAPAIAQRLQDLRSATLDQARDDGERAALEPRLDAHIDDAMDGIGRHVEAQREVFQRRTLGTRQALIQRAATLEHDNDDKIAGLAEAHAGAAQELARLDGVAPGSDEEAGILKAARSQILRRAIDERIANARPQQAVDFYDRVKAALTPDDRRALEGPIGVATDTAATDAWLTRETAKDGAPLDERAGLDDGLSDMQRLILRAKIAARDSAAESSRVATVKGLDDQLAAATKAIATQPSQYRIGTLNTLATAYEDAGAPEQAADTRRLVSQESILRLFAQSAAATQQRRLDDFTGPQRTMAEAIMNHQADAFARDPYAAGTALYPDVGSALPEENADGRLRQTRMIETMRATPVSAPASESATIYAANTENTLHRDDVQLAQAAGAQSQGRSVHIDTDFETFKRELEKDRERVVAEHAAEISGQGVPPTEPAPGSPEYQAADADARRIVAEQEMDDTRPTDTPRRGAAPPTEPPPNDPELEKAFQEFPGEELMLPNNKVVVDPKSSTGYVMTPFNDLKSVAVAAKRAKEEHPNWDFSTMFSNASALADDKTRAELEAVLRANLGHGGTFDYQRHAYSPGKDGFTQLRQFRSVSNINVGLFCQQLGLPLTETLALAGYFAVKNSSNRDLTRPPYFLDADTEKYIRTGYDIGKRRLFE